MVSGGRQHTEERKQCAEAAEGAAEASLRRTDYWKLLLGAAVIGGALLGVFEVVGHLLHASQNVQARWLDFAHAFVTAAALGAWGVLFVLRARRRYEVAREELRAQRARLEEERRSVEQGTGVAAILRMMGHEIRNPLHAMVLQTEILKRLIERVPSREREGLRGPVAQLSGEAHRLANLLDDYLTFGRATEVRMDTEAVQLPGLVARVVARHAEALAERGVTLAVSLEPDLPAILGDEDKLEQALDHLLRNAADAIADERPSDAGRKREIRVAARRDGDVVVVTVVDDGPGFADSEAAFRPFYTTKPMGTGMGLAIVHDIVRAHRGAAHAENLRADGATGFRGACVELRFPAFTEDREAAQ